MRSRGSVATTIIKNSLAAGYRSLLAPAIGPRFTKPRTSKNISTISCQYTMQIEISVPKCSSTSKKRCPPSSAEREKRLFKMDRCPELEIGRNSASP